MIISDVCNSHACSDARGNNRSRSIRCPWLWSRLQACTDRPQSEPVLRSNARNLWRAYNLELLKSSFKREASEVKDQRRAVRSGRSMEERPASDLLYTDRDPGLRALSATPFCAAGPEPERDDDAWLSTSPFGYRSSAIPGNPGCYPDLTQAGSVTPRALLTS